MALSSVLVSLGTITAIYGLLTLGLNIKFGYTGLLDIGHVAFFLVGAYTAALLVLEPSQSQQFSEYILGWEWPWIAAIIAGTITAGIAGMLVALPAIRLREDYLAIAVLGISVIAKRTIQSETWLANGPDALKGWSGPLVDLFPLPGRGLFSAIMLGILIFVFWAIATMTIRRLQAASSDANSEPIARGVVPSLLLGITTLGIGFVTARYTPDTDQWALVAPVIAGAIAGGVATGLVIIGLGNLALVVFFGMASLFSWVLLGLLVGRHYGEATLSDLLIGLGMAILFVATFVPLIILGGSDDVMSTVGVFVTLGLFAAFLVGLYYIGHNWSRYGRETSFVSLVGIGVVWLFAIRYFLLSLVVPFKREGIGGAINELLQNILWLIEFTPAGIEFDYSRFVFALAIGTLAAAYILTEITAKSPFGRVLRAIREDEDVATALGKDTFSYKVQGMILGSAMAGLAGGLFAINIGALQHLMFAPRVTFVIFLMLIIGGTANNRGVILGAGIFWAFQKATEDIAAFFPTAARANVQALRLAFIGALLILILYYRPEGIWGEKSTVMAGGEE